MKKGLKNIFKKINWINLIVSFFVVFATAFLGSLFTSKGVQSFWYWTVRPSITPPNWVFPIAWGILFFFIFISLYLCLNSAKNKKMSSNIELVFGINLILNFLWGFFFFGLRNPAFAFADLILLWLSIFAMIFVTKKINRKASWLLIPYLLWVSFAGVLNYLSLFR
ncbi:MAG: TspO/MBR family protein [Nanoarchaeota archaeon]